MNGISFHNVVITRRNLPHWKAGGVLYWITFRLADSIPYDKLFAWQEAYAVWATLHPKPWDDTTWNEYHERFGDRLEKWLDAGMGSRALARSDVREEVRKCLLYFDGDRFDLYGAVIMPTHVHCLMKPFGGYQLSKLMKSIKGLSARRANELLNKSGAFWQEESYDRIVRNEAQYNHFMKYVFENPLKAKLQESEYWLYVR